MKILDRTWFTKHAKQIENKSRYRYTPKLNVDLPIAEVFDGICRSPEFYSKLRTEFGKMLKEYKRIPSDNRTNDIENKFNEYRLSFDDALNVIKPIKEYNNENIDWRAVNEKSANCIHIGWELINELHLESEKIFQATKEKNPNYHSSRPDTFNNHIHYIRATLNHLRYFEEFAESVSGKLSNTPFFVLLGIAGSGKTHLFCDIAAHKLKKSENAIILFGEYFNPQKSFLENILNQIGLDTKITEEEFLSQLDELGKKSLSRSLILIDALNETADLNYWGKYIDHLMAIVGRYKNIAISVSIRSGFENRIIETPKLEELIQQEHQGFEFREWEAVTKFFREFSLPLPEIPLLGREFHNPLFLLLFCKAFQERSRKGAGDNFFKGHEGTTYVFEKFVDSVSAKIEDYFKIGHGTKTNLWETVIKPVAQLMIEENKDRVTEAELTEIILASHKTISVQDLLFQLEKNLLLVMVPNYNNGNDTLDFRFPFQKFSEHLKARYLFKKFEKDYGKNRDIKSLKKFFSPRGKIGRYLKEKWDYGLVEALCIDVPERFKGEEFYKVAPYVSIDLMNEAFIQSLIWRKPSAFKENLKDVLKYLNEHFGDSHSRDQVYLTLLSVASVPNHPLNAHFLFEHLNKMTMAERDAIWSSFLHYHYGAESSVDRILEWGWSGIAKSHIKDESLELLAISLCWFLTTTNRVVRDKATKALAETLRTRISIVVPVLEKFKNVNDPYITERLYCAAYGAVLASNDGKQDIATVATWVYANYFEKRDIPLCILTRDYMRGIVKTAFLQNLVSIDEKTINPPYGSKFPKSIPSFEILKEKYKTENYNESGYHAIWSSVMYRNGGIADFGNYVLGSALRNWTQKRLNRKYTPTKVYISNFKQSLTRRQVILFNRLYGFQTKKVRVKWTEKEVHFVVRGKTDKELQKILDQHDLEIKKQKRQFKEQLNKSQLKQFTGYIEPYIGGYGRIREPHEEFDASVGERWVFNRVIQLGYDPKQHRAFDSGGGSAYGYSRYENKVERIGKKYQWIAFHEFLGLVADNFVFKKERWNDNAMQGRYEGPWQLYVRDIDSSCLLNSKPQESSFVPSMQQSKGIYDAWRLNDDFVKWLRTSDDLPDPKNLLEYTDNTGRSWIVLEATFDWEQKTLPENETYELVTRKLWYIAKSYLVRETDIEAIKKWSNKQWFFGDWMPRSDQFRNVFLGEYPDHPAFIFHDIPYHYHSGWTDVSSGKDEMPGRILVTDDTYSSSWSSKDHATEEPLNIALPAKYLIKKMKLKHTYNDSRFFDEYGKLVAFDPSQFGADLPSCVLFDKEMMLQFLKKKKLNLFWTLCGEKQTIGGMTMGQPFGWLEITGSYFMLPTGDINGQLRSRVKKMG